MTSRYRASASFAIPVLGADPQALGEREGADPAVADRLAALHAAVEQREGRSGSSLSNDTPRA